MSNCLTTAQSLLLQASAIVEARKEHFRQRREKLKGSKFHQPGPGRVVSSFDAIDYGDEGFDLSAPFGEGMFDDFLFPQREGEESIETN